jgi:carboxymethylenebutenolidase
MTNTGVPLKTESITYPANGVEGMAYLARPDDAAKHPGVIVIQEWWGLDEHIKDVARRVAAEGYVALAPDLYHGEVATEPDEARKLAMGMNREQAMKDLAGAVEYLKSLPDVEPKQVGCMGFCMGGALTFALAGARPDVAAAAPFYGGTPAAEQLAKIQAEVVASYGADDGGIPIENVRKMEQALKDAGKAASVTVYDGAPHSFFNDTKPSYRPEAAKRAWEQVLALFERRLRG